MLVVQLFCPVTPGMSGRTAKQPAGCNLCATRPLLLLLLLLLSPAGAWWGKNNGGVGARDRASERWPDQIQNQDA